MSMLSFGSVCSGIEAASVAWQPLGWKAAWFSEIEPFPSAVLAHHYPDVPNLGDMTTLPARIRSGEVAAPDLLCGGTPCQAFSVAGLRRSLDDVRGNLSLTFCEIANAIDAIKPAIIFWENVPGVLNTKDNAFGCFLAGLAGEDEALVPPGGRWTNAGFIDGPARAVAWRVFDAQYFGVAQRRRRVFVVASARNDVDPAAVLFERESLRRDSAPSREAREGVAVCPTLRAGGNRTGGDRPPGTDVDTADSLIVQPYAVANCLTARMHKGINSTLDEGQTPVVQAIAIQDITPREKAQNGKGWNDDGTAYTVDTHATQGVVAPTITATNDPSRSPQSSEVTQQVAAVHSAAMQVRRLTPVECERLQGFPDGYTNIPWRGKPESPDGPRYKALGNSWAVPVVRWIGERISRAIA
jgi:DNA (cytosine-5)-methyltransferase 1